MLAPPSLHTLQRATKRLRTRGKSDASTRTRAQSDASAISNQIPDSVANGFASTYESPCLVVNSAFVADFSFPEELLTFQPQGQAIIAAFANGDWERKLHCNTELKLEEQNGLQHLQEEAKANGQPLFPSITVMATRYLSHAKDDAHKAFSMMLKTQEWRTEFFAEPLTDVSVAEDIRHGIVYFIGRDSGLRPTLVFRARRIPAEWLKAKQYERIMRLFIFCVEYFLRFMILPGRVETFNIIADLKDLSVAQIPLAALGQIHKSMGSHYLGRGAKTYICNMSWLLSSVTGAVKSMLTERQVQKLVFVKDVAQFREDFALHQLEEDLGGTRPVASEFWPFPLQPGPFQAGHLQGPNSSSIPRVHEVFTSDDIRGRLWDVTLRVDENTRFEYTDMARSIFKLCNVLVPENCPGAPEEGVAVDHDLELGYEIRSI